MALGGHCNNQHIYDKVSYIICTQPIKKHCELVKQTAVVGQEPRRTSHQGIRHTLTYSVDWSRLNAAQYHMRIIIESRCYSKCLCNITPPKFHYFSRFQVLMGSYLHLENVAAGIWR